MIAISSTPFEKFFKKIALFLKYFVRLLTSSSHLPPSHFLNSLTRDVLSIDAPLALGKYQNIALTPLA